MQESTSILMLDEQKPTSSSKIVQEFQYLLEKSQQLFIALRELSPSGRNWQPHFQRTFEVYTRLWKFQQQHRLLVLIRATLENKEYYDLKRWEIGEIASKIGQLYYHYYLRTSETNYLLESFVFYDAIRERAYFRDVLEAKNVTLMVKKLRFYARFIVVCLLLNRNEHVRNLMEELVNLVDEYQNAFKPTDSEWGVVLSEIATFLEAEKKLSPVDQFGNPLKGTTRLNSAGSSEKDGSLRLQEAILVGNFQNQIKFSELTLDIYRVLQSLEREPSILAINEDRQADIGESTVALDTGRNNHHKEDNARRQNARKYLLYRPTFATLMVNIANCFKDVTDGNSMMIYVSADGTKLAPGFPNYSGGIATSANLSSRQKGDVQNIQLVHSLHPNDVLPFTRKPLFLVVDSTNSVAFDKFPRVFGAPFCALMSPTEYPSILKDTSQIGGLFTLFLTDPLRAYAFVSDISQMEPEIWLDLGSKCDRIVNLILDSLYVDDKLDDSYKRFIEDEFLALYCARFVFMEILLIHHTAFKETKNRPRADPSFGDRTLDSELILEIKDLVEFAGKQELYSFTLLEKDSKE